MVDFAQTTEVAVSSANADLVTEEANALFEQIYLSGLRSSQETNRKDTHATTVEHVSHSVNHTNARSKSPVAFEHKKSLLESRYYAEACNEWWGLSQRLSVWVI